MVDNAHANPVLAVADVIDVFLDILVSVLKAAQVRPFYFVNHVII